MLNIQVKTGQGVVRGAADDGVVSFKGISFAAPPEGPLRFGPPAPPEAWDGVREATAFGPVPPQPGPGPGVPSFWRPEDGLDCLTLNVWSPAPGAARLPVMVWIYGGRWEYGAASLPQYDATALARSGVVVVTLNYRVGFEGFGHVPGAPENRGLLDQLAALRWVHANIEAFGGDPGDVTLFGQSAGAASAVFQGASPAAEGLFHRIIAQSIPSSLLTPEEARQTSEKIAQAAGAAPETLSPEALLEAQATLGPGALGPVLDGHTVTAPPWEGVRPGIDVVCGFTHEEFRVFTPILDPATTDLDTAAAMVGLPDGAADVYRAARPRSDDAALFIEMVSDATFRMPVTWLAENHARAGGRTWLYDFVWGGPAFGAAHGVDVPFTFGVPDSRFAQRLLGAPPPAEFATLSEAMRESWTAFARTGDPGWPRFTLENPQTRLWDTTPTDVPYPLADFRPSWGDGRRAG